MKYFLVGIKGTGLSHLAAYLVKGGNEVEGCDVSEDFFTSIILKGITVHPLDSPLPSGTDVVVYSTSYENRSVPAMEEGRKRGVKIFSYPQMLAVLSSAMPSLAVCGTHGKSTTCAVASFLASSLTLPYGSVYGSFLLGNEKVFHDGDEGITLDEAFIRGKSKDLHSAFSLNDMFRFRRELFGNSAADMSDAIELVSAMSSYQEAEDYFYNDLGWDSGSEEVEEFMTIIRNHFR